jgi:phenylalanyl-tRNA synthetase beta chain
VRLFEIGTVFAPAPEAGVQPREATRLALVLTGKRAPLHWSGESEPFDLWDLKGLYADLAATLQLDPESLAPLESVEAGEPFRPSRGFRIVGAEGERIGAAGEIAAGSVDAPPWAETVFGLELQLLPQMTHEAAILFEPLPAFPGIKRDVTLLVPDELPAAAVTAVVREAGGDLLESVTVFDEYRGHGVPEGVRSIGYRLRFRAPDRTLTDVEADTATERVLRRLEEELDVRHRA